MGSLFEARVAWVPANDMRGSPLCSENLRSATAGKMTKERKSKSA